MSFRTTLILAAAVACWTVPAVHAADDAAEVGDEAPDFTLPNATGDEIKLSELRGEQSVLLAFYPRDFTPG